MHCPSPRAESSVGLNGLVGFAGRVGRYLVGSRVALLAGLLPLVLVAALCTLLVWFNPLPPAAAVHAALPAYLPAHQPAYLPAHQAVPNWGGSRARCVSCHTNDYHAILMPHPPDAHCASCHSGSPTRVGCPSCHSVHTIDNIHTLYPTCESCHAEGSVVDTPLDDVATRYMAYLCNKPDLMLVDLTEFEALQGTDVEGVE